MSTSTKARQNPFSEAVLNWFQVHGRKNLPWQQNPNPYRVWISEIMLQQTQVSTVIPYYEKFMLSFPDIKQLALAESDKVLHHWTGLGYYARARNLHKTARLIHHEHNGVFPSSFEGLIELPGIGRSTAGAIIALAGNKRAAILDGNVKRVLCRYHCIEGWPQQGQTLEKLWALAEQLTPPNDCRDYTQAMMDLGATLCTRTKPQCSACPLQLTCQAYLSNRMAEFPNKKTKKLIPQKSTQMIILHSPDGQKVLLEKRPPQGIWGGLWSFPEIQESDTIDHFLSSHGFSARAKPVQCDEIRHTFSHFRLIIKPQLLSLSKMPAAIMEKPDWHWYDLDKPSELGLAAPVNTLLKKLGNK
tara:strand:- start:53379 stop:54452 length:1074 start_codon:yes stop_codon:yes gene_type:complete